MVVVVIGYWLWVWHKGGSSGGDSFCKGGSFRRTIVSACVVKVVVIVRVLVMVAALVVVVVMGMRRTATITINTTTTTKTTNTNTKYSIK